MAATVGGAVAGLSVSRIDPAQETRRYSEEVVAKAAPALDEQGRALLEEDLRSPCTEEIAVFSAFAETVARGEHGFVVLDTAPTGHTLLLLDAAEAYHREVSRTTSDLPDSVSNLLPRLRDPEFTRVLIVTLAEATPVHEAASLQEDLRRAGIEPYAWVINQSFAGDGFRDPVLVERGLQELPFIDEVRERHARQIVLIPWKPEAPVGPERLGELAKTLEGERVTNGQTCFPAFFSGPVSDLVDLRGHGRGRGLGLSVSGGRAVSEPLQRRHDLRPHRHRPDPDDVSAARQGEVRGDGACLRAPEGAGPLSDSELGGRAASDVRPGGRSSSATSRST